MSQELFMCGCLHILRDAWLEVCWFVKRYLSVLDLMSPVSCFRSYVRVAIFIYY